MSLAVDSPPDQPVEAEVTATTAPPPAARRWGTVALAVAIAVGMLLGYAAGWLTPTVTRPGDASPEAGFAREMTTHHAQAVEMGLEAFARATNPGVRTLGVDIATGQQGEIGMFQTWLREWHLDATGAQPPMAWMPGGTAAMVDGLMPGMATPAEMDQLRNAKGVEVDRLFLRLMIQHHLGGIHMLDAILAKTDNSEVLQASRRMKNVQQTELNELRGLQEQVGS
ncbi:DUF305 domain-containing protein [Rhizomonospora bruguierae]|uniref:DUF305 domain-containing protein n=1 Tax=Rhizomonospora bruguierae TaxID=1581705 RepID=UPI001BD11655|nr:DUF305 domain-containing protein [Micromonospora sp. NBRC 107566]